MKTLTLLALALVLGIGAGAAADLARSQYSAADAPPLPLPQQHTQDRPDEPRRGPPPEALAACRTLAAGTACTFSTPYRGLEKGSCWAPEGRPLACRPNDRPPPPPAAAPPKR
ncbi:MAG: hypothetical protein V4505_01025 [Pseudomonadota bacterium]